MKIYFEDNHLLVVEKPVNIPTQADSSQDEDLLSMIKAYLVTTYHKPGDAFVGLVHRLDRPVGGVMVFAKTSKAASRLSEQVRNKTFQKRYCAVLNGRAEPERYADQLVKDERTNTSRVVKSGGKLAIMTLVDTQFHRHDNLTTALINLETGRSHQIRVQCSYHGHPLWGDQRYNPKAKPGQQIALHAVEISFLHPISKEKLTFTSELPHRYPFDLSE